MNKNRLAEAAQLAREGHISSSLEMLLREDQKQMSFPIASNIAALYLQLGNTELAIKYATKAISLDSYSHIGYYNRFLCYLQVDSKKAKCQLQKALSCLCLLRGFEQNNPKLLNKSISYCQQNAKAYLFRAKLNQGKNSKLIQNDYSAAIQYDEYLPQIYQQRALYYRKQNKKEQFEQDCITYIRLKQQKNWKRELVADDDQEDQQDINTKIQKLVSQFQQLLLKVKSQPSASPLTDSNEIVSKLPLSSIQSNIDRKEDEELLLSDRPDPQEGSTQTITIKKEELQFKKKDIKQNVEKTYKDYYEDQCSDELDDRINKLQKQIQQKGGKISVAKKDDSEQLDLSDPTNFLTEQIEKAIIQISKMSSPDTLNEVKSVKSAGSQGSKLSARQLTIQQFSNFHNVKIEIVNLEDIQSYNKKQMAKVRLKYGQKNLETGMSRYEWRQSFSFNIVDDNTEIEVSVVEKGGIFRSDYEIGEGTINLLQVNNVKCILGNKEKKVAILYFKVHLS